MSLGFRVSGRIGKPVAEVFDAVVNPTRLSGYFTTIGGASAPLVAGTDGLVLSRTLRKYVARGEAVAKIVGTAPLPQRRGYLLED